MVAWLILLKKCQSNIEKIAKRQTEFHTFAYKVTERVGTTAAKRYSKFKAKIGNNSE